MPDANLTYKSAKWEVVSAVNGQPQASVITLACVLACLCLLG
jgi:hypothetical protein